MTGVGSGRRDPWRPVPAGRGVGKRFARPADHSHPGLGQERAGPAGLTADFGASPEGVMTMISTLTAAGTPARHALPSSTGPLSTGPAGLGPVSAEPPNADPASTAPAGALPMPRSVPGAALS